MICRSFLESIGAGGPFVASDPDFMQTASNCVEPVTQQDVSEHVCCLWFDMWHEAVFECVPVFIPMQVAGSFVLS